MKNKLLKEYEFKGLYGMEFKVKAITRTEAMEKCLYELGMLHLPPYESTLYQYAKESIVDLTASIIARELNTDDDQADRLVKTFLEDPTFNEEMDDKANELWDSMGDSEMEIQSRYYDDIYLLLALEEMEDDEDPM